MDYLKAAGKAVFNDQFVTKADVLLHSAETANHSIGLIGVPLSKSSISHSGASFSPTVIRRMLQSFTTYCSSSEIDLVNSLITDFGDVVMHATDITESQSRIKSTIEKILIDHQPNHMIILGGDHSISFPSIAAFSKQSKVGVIQFDAHHDLRNLDDGGPTNGTPFRSLIEGNYIEGKNLVQIGIRDFMNSKAYSDYAKEKGVKVFTVQDVQTKSIELIVKEAIDYLSREVDMIYLSVDVDVLDQAFAPGCPAIGPGGLDSATLLKAIEIVSSCSLVKAIDIVEIDPTIDFRDMTSKMAAYIILTFLKNVGKN
ncbi:formimidoylglutamase [Litchfieldia alkalitelluris]|uniref:formimidoylglutamase n=1 Tax=Litchfieldia alkalitelluris TaxID=304268 RepID=UPI000996E5FC|nr:formimidoylglutamase [Litchfieldia alkalitelluris]